MDAYPAACREHDGHGRTPLHSACWNNAPEQVLKLLLEEYPNAVTKSDVFMGTLEEYDFENQAVGKLVSHVYRLVCGISNQDVKDIMIYFMNVEWWGGVAIVVDFYPA
eukprot:14089825-Ditylum_brightwellii.AAC.1